MVAHAGPGWQLAASLIALEVEANRLAPTRSRRSDGSIGDAAHAASASDHNPLNGWVHALDLTNDPGAGFNAHQWANHLALVADPRIKYMISAGRIWNPTIGDKPGVWRTYHGTNPHNSHLHVSIRNTPEARRNTGPWLTGQPPPPPTPAPAPPPVAATPEDSPMFIIAEGFGIFAKVGDILTAYPDLVTYARDKDRSPGVPVITLSNEQARVIIPNLLKVQARVVG